MRDLAASMPWDTRVSSQSHHKFCNGSDHALMANMRAQANGADIKGGTWFETGAEMLNGGTLNYFAVPWGIINNPLPLVVVTLIEVGLLGAAENYRCVSQPYCLSIFSSRPHVNFGGPVAIRRLVCTWLTVQDSLRCSCLVGRVKCAV